MKYGNWTLIDETPGRRGYWNCLCICGKAKEVAFYALKRGGSKSCGCLRAKLARQRTMKAKGFSGAKKLFNSYKWHAKDRNLEFSLSFETFVVLTSSKCHYCQGLPLAVTPVDKRYSNEGQQNSIYRYNGIDRINNYLGYTDLNSVPCCKLCNKAKGTLEYSDFLEWIQRLKRAII